MNKAKAFLLTVVLAGAALEARDASACGGCFVSQTENTQVTGHKMILSVSQQQTTLYDQITYSGDPSSFAWILPIKGLATVGLSSDALFQTLDSDTNVVINSPTLNCSPGCNNGPQAGSFGTGAGGGSTGTGVTVISQQVVGPYETVQLQSTDPHALEDWLAMHGYNVPADVKPVIDAYVAESFDFLALKLVPGKGVSAMRPVRVTTPGASPVLPLRMVAAGTGAITPITLWVLAEGRYDTVNLPSFKIDPSQLVWDWDTQQSNYKSLKQAGFTSTANKGWCVEDAEPFSMYQVAGTLQNLVQYSPDQSGYADDMGLNADKNLADDMTALFGGIDQNSMWITRLEGELSRAALGADLQIGAASDQSTVQHYFQVTKTIGTAPACPTPQPCGGPSGSGWGFWGSGGSPTAGGTCATTNQDTNGALFGGAALVAALAFARRRRLSASRPRR